MARKTRDYAAEYRRRKELQAERVRMATAARAKRAAYQRAYRRRLKEAKAAGFSSVREYERDQIPEEFADQQLMEMLGRRRRGSRLSNAGEIARSLGAKTRAFFRWWYA